MKRRYVTRKTSSEKPACALRIDRAHPRPQARLYRLGLALGARRMAYRAAWRGSRALELKPERASDQLKPTRLVQCTVAAQTRVDIYALHVHDPVHSAHHRKQ